MSTATLETVYERLAETVDAVGPEKETVFLAKLVLLLAEKQDDPEMVLGLIDGAVKDLD